MKAKAPIVSFVLASAAAFAQAPAEAPVAETAAPEPVFVEITGDRVNLRAAPKPEAEVLAQAALGDKLPLHGSVEDAWVAVGVPERCDLWIRSDLLRSGKTCVEGARLRAGAGTRYSIVGELPVGTALEVRGVAGDWSRVAPPALPGVSLFVTNAYAKVAGVVVAAPAVEAPSEPNAPVEVAPAEPQQGAGEEPSAAPAADEPVPTEAVPDAPPLSDSVQAATPEAPPPPPRPVAPPPTVADKGHVSLPPPPPDRSVPVGPAKISSSRLEPDRLQASDGVYAGLLAAAPTFGSHPTKFRLVRTDRHNAPETVCWVYGNTAQLESLRGSQMTVSGAVYWFKGVELPVVFAQEILTGGKRN